MAEPRTLTAAERAVLECYQKRLWDSLDDVMAFWMKHSVDSENGGFYTCLDRHGKRYDSKKYAWLMGRQVWVLCKLYVSTTRYRTTAVLDAASAGLRFLRQHVYRPEDHRCYFSVTAEGEPVQLQRKIFSECFFVMALAGYATAIREQHPDLAQEHFTLACSVLEQVFRWKSDPTLLGHPELPGQRERPGWLGLAQPMILVNVIGEMQLYQPDVYMAERRAFVREMQLHVPRQNRQQQQQQQQQQQEREQRKKSDPLNPRPATPGAMDHVQVGAAVPICENVRLDGSNDFGSPEGRLMNPGHAIEAAWFLLDFANQTGSCGCTARTCREPSCVAGLAVNMMEWAWAAGWDAKHGGLFAFVDVLGFSPQQLEWDMKLWWAHNEAMIGFLMAWERFGEPRALERFQEVTDFALKWFADPLPPPTGAASTGRGVAEAQAPPVCRGADDPCAGVMEGADAGGDVSGDGGGGDGGGGGGDGGGGGGGGEWFGYLNRSLDVTHRFKGGNYKGCFHVPRALLFCALICDKHLASTAP